MIDRRHFVSLFGCLIAASLLTAQPAKAAAADDAKLFIEGLANQAVEALTKADTPRSERIEKFRILLKEHFDVPAIGRWVLGRYWKSASVEQQTEYLALFEDLIVATYVDRFAEYTGESLNITSTEANGETDSIVHSEIKRPAGGPPVRVDWRVRKVEAGWRIYDVVVEGVSMSQTQRSEFGSVVSRGGGDVEVLLNALRDKTASIKSE